LILLIYINLFSIFLKKYISLDYFDNLSDECLLQIFKWIPRPLLLRYACVSKRWYSLMFDESLWNRFDLSDKIVYSEILIKLLNRGIKIFGLGRAEVKKYFKYFFYFFLLNF